LFCLLKEGEQINMDLGVHFGRICSNNICNHCTQERNYHSWIRSFEHGRRNPSTLYFKKRLDRPSFVKCSLCHGTGSRESLQDFKLLLKCNACNGIGLLVILNEEPEFTPLFLEGQTVIFSQTETIEWNE